NGTQACQQWLQEDLKLSAPAAQQLGQYLASAHAALGCLPTQDRIVFERFFDEAGDTHLVVHSTFGSRINRAWGLALRKKFCRQFNFELQASALEDSLVLSLGPTHSFPLEEPVRYVKSASLDKTLEQAVLQAPMFPTRWRWVASVSLAIKRFVGGKRVVPQFQRMDAEDLLTVVFPDAVACQDNLPGEREVPDHPLIRQALQDCFNEVMDIEGLRALLKRIEAGAIEIVCRDLTAPSALCEAILNARPYAFLDDGAAEERRTQAVRTRGNYDPVESADLGRLNPAAIEKVRDEVRPAPADADELHDALVVHGFISAAEGKDWQPLFALLKEQRRAVVMQGLWVAAERLAEMQALLPNAVIEGEAPVLGEAADADSALCEILRGRLDMLGPVTEQLLADSLSLPLNRIQSALTSLQAEGYVMRGDYSQCGQEEVCERRLLARIHRYSRDQKRAEIEPVSPSLFMRHLFEWQAVYERERREGEVALQAVIQQLEGFPIAASAWEADVLTARIQRYLPDMLDRLCASGQVVWQRPASPGAEEGKRKAGPVKATPILLSPRETAAHWRSGELEQPPALSSRAEAVYAVLKNQGASFLLDLTQDSGLLRTEVEQALAELVSHGLVTADSFAGLRALIAPSHKKAGYGRRRRRGLVDIDAAGRWSLARHRLTAEQGPALADPRVEYIARVLLRRYGVVFRRMLERESALPPWRELFYVYRRMEARDEIRGGRFVQGFAGEQFALPEAVAALKRLKREPDDQRLVTLSAADPLNLVGIILPGSRVPAVPGNRLLFRNGKAVALQVGSDTRYLEKVSDAEQWDWRNRLLRQTRPAAWQAPPSQSQ
ncbi:MAG: Lhr family helicase, partial [Nevskiales bacterium]